MVSTLFEFLYYLKLDRGIMERALGLLGKENRFKKLPSEFLVMEKYIL